MKAIILIVAGLAALVSAQVPGLGWCPEYPSMADFDLDRYTGVWYEQERYFTVLEVGSRCVRSNYTKGVDGKFRVSNEITNRLTGVRRVLDGVVQNIGKGGEGKIAVKYSTLPVPIDTQYSVLDTDYDTYSVVWSCSSLGPINTQNSWVMTRERLSPGTVLQKAYGILDKYKISRSFFVKTDQADCIFSDPAGIPPKSDGAVKSEEIKPEMPAEPMKAEELPMKEEPIKAIPEPVKAAIEPVKVPAVAEEKPMAEEKPAVLVAEEKPMAVEPVVEAKPIKAAEEPIKIVHEKTEPAKV